MSGHGRRELRIPSGSLVVLIGAAGSGKSTFARRHFRPTEVVSSDACRALVSDEPLDQSASEDAFDLLRYIARKRLRRSRLTVVDATSVSEADRAPLLALARTSGVPAVASSSTFPWTCAWNEIARGRTAASRTGSFGSSSKTCRTAYVGWRRASASSTGSRLPTTWPPPRSCADSHQCLTPIRERNAISSRFGPER